MSALKRIEERLADSGALWVGNVHEMRALLAVASAVGDRNKARCWSACDDQDPAQCVCGSEAVEGCPCTLTNSAIGDAYAKLEAMP